MYSSSVYCFNLMYKKEKASLLYISLSIVHTTSTSTADFLATTCRHIMILYCCTSTCYSHHKVLLLSHLYSEKIRPSAHTHNAADPTLSTDINISLSIYMSHVVHLSGSTCCHVVHFLSSHTIHHVGYTSMFRLEHFQI